MLQRRAMDSKMRSLIFALAVASLGLSSSIGHAADLDYHHRHHRPPPRPYHEPDIYEAPYEHAYTRPVVGFYGYPNDHVLHRGATFRQEGLVPEPYILRRDAPHGIEE